MEIPYGNEINTCYPSSIRIIRVRVPRIIRFRTNIKEYVFYTPVILSPCVIIVFTILQNRKSCATYFRCQR